MSLADLISTENEVFRTYVFWAGVLTLKMLGMSILTGFKRFQTKTFANPEDLPSKKLKVVFGNEDVERVRRAHRNDLENIIPLVTAGFFYTLTSPAPFVAINIFRASAIARILHTIVYAVVPLPQPARAISFAVPLVATAYMAITTILFFL